ncbi:MAG TPA: hypothetical protein VKA48_05435 [Gammaproteobacteria bacterium]|nr:hypothetical protein [Gammaproteobacteria bacterium]
MSWYFQDLAKLKSINPRQEGSGDDAEPAVDLDFEATVGPDELRAALGAATEREVREAFWSGDWIEGSVQERFPGMGTVKVPDREFLDMIAHVDGIKLAPASVHKFAFTVQPDGTAALTFQISMTRPPANALAVFHEHLKTEVPVHVAASQQDLDLEEEQREEMA